MKTIPIQLLQQYQKPGGSFCFLAKAVTKTGEAYGFTSLDTDILFDDGLHVVDYSSRDELRPQRIESTIDYDSDNTDLLGWFNEGLEKLVLAGMFDRAELTIYRIAYLTPEAGAEVVAYGNIGEVDFSTNSKSRRKVEFLGLKERLKTKVGALYSLTCRADYGDEQCGMPFVWYAGQVKAVGSSPYLSFVATGVNQPDNYFELGIVHFVNGDNAGAELEIESWTRQGDDAVVQLSFLAPFPIKAGDLVRFRQDCGKTESDCKAKGNIINMRAEHLTPVENAAVMVPGAYIKSSGAE